MTTDQRRAMIVAATLPLVAEYGGAVTTSQIARAAGIGEGTIFRVFADKEELMDACVIEAMNPDHVLRELGSISLDDPLPARLTDAGEALRAHLVRMGTVLGALHAAGHGRGRGEGERPAARGGAARRGSADDSSGSGGSGSGGSDGGGSDGGGSVRGREASLKATRDAVADLIEPDREALRVEPEKFVTIFLGMLFSRFPSPSGDLDPTTGELVDVLLHGALTGGAKAG
ncbi:helix-turn-helix transcriptional regulator [Microbispora sp. RL4-1S]|uniref:Helix-turn-helix transcriptional regulator n=2 Tax=Microbispora oryzae TaxID=2806554 RepID=A0A940WR84_9ACTN|nr:helix-turn-helix transcriptional regulator [Microbispora oryzae]